MAQLAAAVEGAGQCEDMNTEERLGGAGIDEPRISYAEPWRRSPRLDYPLYRLVADIKLQQHSPTHQPDEGRGVRTGGEAALMV